MSWVIDGAVVGGLFALVVGAVIRWARPRPAIEVLLWSAVVVRFCVPGLGPALWSPPGGVHGSIAAPGAQVAAPAAPAGPFAGITPLELAVGCLVAAGVVIVAVRWWRAASLARHFRATAEPAPAALMAAVARVAEALRISAPAIVMSPDVGAPAVTGLVRPILLWPSRMHEPYTARERDAVLVHELAHLRRRDLWLSRAVDLAACLWWWHPLFRWVVSRLDAAVERAADAWVIEVAPDDRWELASALVRSLEHAPGKGISGAHDVHRRIEELATARPARTGAPGWIATAMVVAAASCLVIVGAERSAGALDAWGVWIDGAVEVTPGGEIRPAEGAHVVAFTWDGRALAVGRLNGSVGEAVRLADGKVMPIAAAPLLDDIVARAPSSVRANASRVASTWAVVPGGRHTNRVTPTAQLASWHITSAIALSIRRDDTTRGTIELAHGDRRCDLFAADAQLTCGP